MSFEDRVRFNWGYHDAVDAHQRGAIFGLFDSTFHKGREMTDTIVENEHYDKVYAAGWGFGYRMSREMGENTPTTSEPAWQEWRKDGEPAPVGRRPLYPEVVIDKKAIMEKVAKAERKRKALLKMTQDCFDYQVELGKKTKPI